jgi:hypothetical protein
VDLTAPPRVAHARPEPVDLLGGVPLPVAARPLAEPVVEPNSDTELVGDDLRGLPGASEVGREHGDRAETRVDQGGGPFARLPHPELGERGVLPPLPAPLEVPLRLAVPDDQEVVHGCAVKQNGRPGLPRFRGGAKLDRSV